MLYAAIVWVMIACRVTAHQRDTRPISHDRADPSPAPDFAFALDEDALVREVLRETRGDRETRGERPEWQERRRDCLDVRSHDVARCAARQSRVDSWERVE